MQAHNNNVEEFLGTPRTIFVVPVYQRNYDWLDGNCEQLFSDIVRAIKNDKEHFLGTICFKSTTSHEKSIIDGQQRLTSITLMLRALYEITEDEELKREISEGFLVNKGHSIDSDFLRVKLHLNERDDEVYRIILNNSFNTAKSKLNAVQRESRIFQNYKLFIKLVSDFLAKKGSAEKLLESLNYLSIIELEIQNENPQEIFESLNSTGLDLTNVDLLRNYLLMQFAHTEQTQLYKKYWSPIEDYVGVDNMESFFVDYLIFKKRSDAVSLSGRRSHINERTLYKAFKDYYVNFPIDDLFEKTETIFSDMKKYAELYGITIFKPDTNLERESPLRRKLYSLLEVNEAGNTRCLLLDLLDKHEKGLISDEVLDETVTAISSYSFRLRVCYGKSFSRQFAGNVMIRIDQLASLDNFADDFWSAMCFGKGASSFPNDDDFARALATKDMYLTLRSRGTKYLLYTLEANSPFPKGLPAFEDETISIEHVIPQTLNGKWKQYLGAKEANEYQQYLHKLGNLTLTSYNSEMSNKSFDEKKVVYASSNFYYTREITKTPKWNLDEVNKRSEALANLAINIWPLPQTHQTAKQTKETLHLLDEDISQFGSTKPTKIYIDDEELIVDAWADFIPVICEKLRAMNEDVFMEIASPTYMKAFTRDDETKKLSQNEDYTHIVEDIYINRKKSAYSTLDLTTRIIREFDTKAGTNVFDSIMFETK